MRRLGGRIGRLIAHKEQDPSYRAPYAIVIESDEPDDDPMESGLLERNAPQEIEVGRRVAEELDRVRKDSGELERFLGAFVGSWDAEYWSDERMAARAAREAQADQ